MKNSYKNPTHIKLDVGKTKQVTFKTITEIHPTLHTQTEGTTVAQLELTIRPFTSFVKKTDRSA